MLEIIVMQIQLSKVLKFGLAYCQPFPEMLAFVMPKVCQSEMKSNLLVKKSSPDFRFLFIYGHQLAFFYFHQYQGYSSVKCYKILIKH